MIRKLALGFSLGVALLAAPASAQDYAPQRVVGAVDIDDLKAIVASLDHTLIEVGSGDEVTLGASADEGTKYILTGTACDRGGIAGCQGVMMQVRYDPIPSITDADLARANREQAAILTWRDDSSGTIGTTRYVVLDHGITMANLRENVRVLLAITPLAIEALVGD